MRVVVVSDRAHGDVRDGLAELLASMPRGAVAVQVREKDLEGGALLELVRSVLAIARPAGAEVWVNDRLDVALAAGADGVHLPERGLSVDVARTVAAGRVKIGCSRHSAEAALAAARDGADLVQLGPIWSVPGKGEPLGEAVLAVRASLPRSCTLVAVGGIDSVARARAAGAAGADAVAVIRARSLAAALATAMK